MAVAGSIADGAAVPWDDESTQASGMEAEVLAELHLLERIVRAHRRIADDHEEQEHVEHPDGPGRHEQSGHLDGERRCRVGDDAGTHDRGEPVGSETGEGRLSVEPGEASGLAGGLNRTTVPGSGP